MNTKTESALFVLWFRPRGSRQRWHKVGRFGTRAEALNAIGSGGDWRIESVSATPTAQPSLFDSNELPAEGAA